MEEGVGFHHDLRGIQIKGKVRSHCLFAESIFSISENVCESWHFIGAPSFFTRLLELLVNVCLEDLTTTNQPPSHYPGRRASRGTNDPQSQGLQYFGFRGSFRLYAYGNLAWKKRELFIYVDEDLIPKI